MPRLHMFLVYYNTSVKSNYGYVGLLVNIFATVLLLTLLLLLLILQYFEWLAAFHVELLQAILCILSALVFLVTCFKHCSRGD
jgi:hypothetical protein